jgi:hypothetical protein
VEEWVYGFSCRTGRKDFCAPCALFFSVREKFSLLHFTHTRNIVLKVQLSAMHFVFLLYKTRVAVQKCRKSTFLSSTSTDAVAPPWRHHVFPQDNTLGNPLSAGVVRPHMDGVRPHQRRCSSESEQEQQQ